MYWVALCLAALAVQGHRTCPGWRYVAQTRGQNEAPPTKPAESDADQNILERVRRLEWLIEEVNDPNNLVHKARYSAELEYVLRDCDRGSLYRRGQVEGSRSPTPGCKVSWTTAARVIRCLGSCNLSRPFLRWWVFLIRRPTLL